MVLLTGRVARAQADRLLVAEARIAKVGAMVAVKERVWTDPAAPGSTARVHERRHPELLVPASMEFADHGEDTNCAADMGFRVLRHDQSSDSSILNSPDHWLFLR